MATLPDRETSGSAGENAPPNPLPPELIASQRVRESGVTGLRDYGITGLGGALREGNLATLAILSPPIVWSSGPVREQDLFRAVWKLTGFASVAPRCPGAEQVAEAFAAAHPNCTDDHEEVLAIAEQAVSRLNHWNFWAAVARSVLDPPPAAAVFRSSPGYQVLVGTARELQRHHGASDFPLSQRVAAEVMLKVTPEGQFDEAAGKRARKRLLDKGIIRQTAAGQPRTSGRQGVTARYCYVASDLYDYDDPPF